MGCLGALAGLLVLVGLQVLADSALSWLPENGWTIAAVGAALVVLLATCIAVVVRMNRRQARQDVEERGWQRKGSLPLRQAPIAEPDRFVSIDEAKAALRCRQLTLNVLTLDGLDPCWSETGELGFTRESVDAEVAYRRTTSRARVFLRTVGRGLASGV